VAADPGRQRLSTGDDDRPGRALLLAAGLLWTLPNTLAGLCAGLAGMAAGARPRLDRDALALVFHRWPWGPGGAMTLGNVILHTGERLDVRCTTYVHRAGLCRDPEVLLRDHERAHVLQYMVLGPLFLPLYLLCGGISVRNRFERAADATHAAVAAGGLGRASPCRRTVVRVDTRLTDAAITCIRRRKSGRRQRQKQSLRRREGSAGRVTPDDWAFLHSSSVPSPFVHSRWPRRMHRRRRDQRAGSAVVASAASAAGAPASCSSSCARP